MAGAMPNPAMTASFGPGPSPAFAPAISTRRKAHRCATTHASTDHATCLHDERHVGESLRIRNPGQRPFPQRWIVSADGTARRLQCNEPPTVSATVQRQHRPDLPTLQVLQNTPRLRRRVASKFYLESRITSSTAVACSSSKMAIILLAASLTGRPQDIAGWCLSHRAPTSRGR